MKFFNGIKQDCTVRRFFKYYHCKIFTWVIFQFVKNYLNENIRLYQFYVYAELNGFTTKICSNCRNAEWNNQHFLQIDGIIADMTHILKNVQGIKEKL